VAKNKVSPSKTGQSTRGTKINLANREAEGLGGEGEFLKAFRIKINKESYYAP